VPIIVPTVVVRLSKTILSKQKFGGSVVLVVVVVVVVVGGIQKLLTILCTVKSGNLSQQSGVDISHML
jgi:hypothetical protein